MPPVLLVIVGILFFIGLIWAWFIWRIHWMRRALRISSPTGIDEQEYLELEGTRHFLCHRGENRNNPVLLFLHGGPGASLVPFLHGFQRPWEEHVTVVHWDQRGTGKTALANHPLAGINEISLEQSLRDLAAVVGHLKEKYQKKQIYLMGYSWGTVLADDYVKQHPEDVLAYFGITPLVDMQANETWAYERMVDLLVGQHRPQDQNALFGLAPYPNPDFDEMMMKKIQTLRSLQMKYQKGKSSPSRMLMLLFASPYLSYEEYRSTQSPLFFQQQIPLLRYLYSTFRLNKETAVYQVPVYYFWGEQDLQNSPQLIATYAASIQAPATASYPLKEAGHLPFLDDTLHFNEVFLALLQSIHKEEIE